MSASVRVTIGVLVAAFAALAAPSARAKADLCGATIVDDVRLDQDLTCPSAGLIVGADGIKINLQGHTIAGAGTGTGISVVGHNDVSIFGGTVEGFFTGVRIGNAADVVIKDTILRGNVDGVDVQAGSSDITVKASEFWTNTSRGVMLRGGSTESVINDNLFSGNRIGVLVFAPTDSIVKGNTISDNLVAGIRLNVLATANLVRDNTVTSNPIGLDFLLGPNGGPLGNMFINNTVTLNGCGINGPYAGNVFKENHLTGNTVDICG